MNDLGEVNKSGDGAVIGFPKPDRSCGSTPAKRAE